MTLAAHPVTPDDIRHETVTVISDVLRDVGLLKRDLLRELTYDVPFAAISALGVLEQHGPMRVGELADHLAIDLSVASRHASGLEDRGLVERRPADNDRRAHELTLTDHGRQILLTVRSDLLGKLDEALGPWTQSDLVELTRLLARLRSTLSSRVARTGQPPTLQ